MKKIMLVLLLFIIKNSLYSHTGGMTFSLLPFNYSMNYSKNGNIHSEINLGILGLFVDNDPKSGIGIEFKFPQYFFLFDKHMLNFVYLNLHWNILILFSTKDTYESVFGPFFSINYLNWYIHEGFEFSNYIFNFGLRYSFRYDELQMITIETGYKNVKGNNNYFFSIEINFLTFLGIYDKIYWRKYRK
jgi:hypothetical protein